MSSCSRTVSSQGSPRPPRLIRSIPSFSRPSAMAPGMKRPNSQRAVRRPSCSPSPLHRKPEGVAPAPCWSIPFDRQPVRSGSSSVRVVVGAIERHGHCALSECWLRRSRAVRTPSGNRIAPPPSRPHRSMPSLDTTVALGCRRHGNFASCNATDGAAATRLRWTDRPGPLKPQSSATPYLGGLAVALGVAVGVAAYRPVLLVPTPHGPDDRDRR